VLTSVGPVTAGAPLVGENCDPHSPAAYLACQFFSGTRTLVACLISGHHPIIFPVMPARRVAHFCAFFAQKWDSTKAFTLGSLL